MNSLPTVDDDAHARTRVFISYSRKDAHFASRLAAALSDRGYDGYLDLKDIAPAEPWKERLDALILLADAVVVVISPDSIRSEICAWEVGRAVELSKRLVPVLYRPLSEETVPDPLARLNWVSAADGAEGHDPLELPTHEALDKISAAVEVDIAWERERTRLVHLAERWWRDGQPDSQLLRIGEIALAEAWAARRPPNSPPPPDSLYTFLAACRRKEDADNTRLRRIVGRSFVQPAMQALADGHNERALRLAAAGALLANDLHFVVVPELWKPTARAVLSCRTQIALHRGIFGLRTVALSPDERFILTASSDRTARLWDPVTGLELSRFTSGAKGLLCAEFSPDGRRILAASADHTARIWDTDTGSSLSIMSGHTNLISTASFSPDGTRVLTASEDETVRVWNAETGAELITFRGHQGPLRLEGRARIITGMVQCAAFSKDGKRVASGSADGAVKLWLSTTGEEVAALHGHTLKVRCLAFSHNGAHLATGSDDGTTRIWDASTGIAVSVLAGHTSWINSVCFSPMATAP